MQYATFGNTGMSVSRLCLGTMSFSRKLDEEASRRVVDEAIAAGVNFIDTAESYGESEELLGRILAGRRDSVYLATKVYRKRARDGHAGRNSRINIIHSLDRSLQLLQTDHVDLYQLHHPDDETPLDETMAALDQAVRQGKTRYVGVSNHYAWQMAYMLGRSAGTAPGAGPEPIVSLQCRYNPLDRAVERETAAFCQRFNVATMIYSPLNGGLLSGKYQRNTPAPEDSRGTRHPRLKNQLSEDHTYDVLEALSSLAKEHDMELPQLGILWLLAKPMVTTVILGGSKPEHFQIPYAVQDRTLPVEVVTKIDELTESFRHRPFFNQGGVAGARLLPR